MSLPIFAITLFVSAFLLFLVQPMIGKMILPRLGGTPQVWNTCMVFFQFSLLVGYGYTHCISTFLKVRTQLLAHCALLLVPIAIFIIGTIYLAGAQESQYNVVLEKGGGDTTAVSKVISDAIGIDSKMAELWIEQAPKALQEKVAKEEAEQLKKDLEAAGATVSMPEITMKSFFYAAREFLNPIGGGNPIAQTLTWLLFFVFVPFCVVATSAPLLQRWFGHTGHPSGDDPYFLYAASNIGSFASLIIYPFLMEWLLLLDEQSWTWIIGYVILAALVFVCAGFVWKAPPMVRMRGDIDKTEPVPDPLPQETKPEPEALLREEEKAKEEAEETGVKAGSPPKKSAGGSFKKGSKQKRKKGKKGPAPAAKVPDKAPTIERRVSRPTTSIIQKETSRLDKVTPLRRLRWIALAAIPSSLMLGVTTYITTDLSPIPLLWLLPLMMYLLSFVLVFSKWPVEWVGQPHTIMVIAQPFAVALLLASLVVPGMFGHQFTIVMAIHFLAFFLTTMVCHGELAKDRPSIEHLTEFYLMMSIGGVLGGMFNALFAPLILPFVFEYSAAIFLSGLMRPTMVVSGWAEEWFNNMFGQSESGGHGKKGTAGNVPGGNLSYGMDVVLPLLLLIFMVVMTFGLGEFIGRTFSRMIDGSSSLTRSGQVVFYALAYGIPLVVAIFFMGRPIRYGLAIGAILAVSGMYEMARGEEIVHRDRSYFGIIQVKMARSPKEYTTLIHGRINHGMNFTKPTKSSDWGDPQKDFSRLATTYYHRWGPAGVVMNQYVWFNDKLNEYPSDARMPASLVGFAAQPLSLGNLPTGVLVDLWSEPPYATIGLGTGTMASYARPFQSMHYYEIDNAIVRLSTPPRKPSDPRQPTDKYLTPELYKEYVNETQSRYRTFFTYLGDAKARGAEVWVFMGDARLRMAQPYKAADQYTNPKELENQWNNAYSIRVIDGKEGGGPDDFYHMIVVDAFSSDAIPVHLLTKEAMKMYFKKLTEEGILCVHTSNRYVDLVPVVADVAASLGLHSKRGHDGGPKIQERLEPDGTNLLEYIDETGHFTSEWVMVARKPEYLEKLQAPPGYEERMRIHVANEKAGNPDEPYWRVPDSLGRHVWTDDYSNLMSVFREFMR